jgi:hypothetical protein
MASANAGRVRVLPAAGNCYKFVRPRAQFVANVINEKIKIATRADHARKCFASDWNGRGEYHGFDPSHPFPPAQLSGEIRKLPVKPLQRYSLTFCHCYSP